MMQQSSLSEAHGTSVSWAKNKVQVFGGVLDATVQSVHACDEVIEILKNFTYLGSVVITMVSRPKKSHGGLAWPTALWTRSTRYFALSIPVQMDKDSNLQVAGDLCLTQWL